MALAPTMMIAVEQVCLLVAARFDARRAGPDGAAAFLEILDQRRQRLERRHMGHALAALAHQVDRGAGQEDRDLQARGDAAIGNREATEDSSESMPLVMRTTSLSVVDCIVFSMIRLRRLIFRRARRHASLAGMPEALSENPQRVRGVTQDDVLSALLSTVRLSGSLQFCFMPAGAWQTDATPRMARMSGGSRRHHAVSHPCRRASAGSRWMDRHLTLEEGDVVVFPFGTGHRSAREQVAG